MNKLLLLALLALAFVVMACSRNSHNNAIATDIGRGGSKPISSETTKITYYHHTNSGIAISTKVEMNEDSLTWEYYEARTGLRLRDTSKFDKNDFAELVNELSLVRFSAKDAHDTSSGGEGYAIAFEQDAKQYFFYNDSYKLSGDYEKVETLILQFIETHKTECEKRMEELSKEPHESRFFGEFETLPEELKPYEVQNQ